MKNILNVSTTFLLLLLLNTVLSDGDNTCDGGSDTLAMVQWYTQVYNFAKRNHNVTQHIEDTHMKLGQVDSIMQDNHKILEGKLLQMERKLEALQQSCDRTKNANIDIVIQRRQDGTVDFYRTWVEYKLGFGNRSGEFFIGLETLHKLTNTRPHELLIVMEDFENERRYARYDLFIIGSEAEKYALKQLGKYSGSAGDSLTAHLSYNFTTKDQDNDVYGENCAVKFTGAWWYHKCHHSNLNGLYLKGKHNEYAKGVDWLAFRGHNYSLKFVEMILRPI